MLVDRICARNQWLSLWFAAIACGCVATPLPTPPSADVQRMTLNETPGLPGTAVDLRGLSGAIADADQVRVTSSRAWTEVAVARDGSFAALAMPVASPDTLYIEGLTSLGDYFLISVSAQVSDGSVSIVASGGDRDMDGSPDAVDCAPDDPGLQGQRCARTCSTEICNGVDDNCNGVADEGCGTPGDVDGDRVSPPADCNDNNSNVFPGANEICNGIDDDCNSIIDEGCSGTCATDSDCPIGSSVCVSGTCQCMVGRDACGAECVDLTSDPLHCSRCDLACAAGQICDRSACVP